MAIIKAITQDREFSATGRDRAGRPVDNWKVTQQLLACLGEAWAEQGASSWSYTQRYASSHSMDCLRRWSSTGQSVYSDMSHPEGCTAEVLRPREFAAQCLSQILLLERARQLAEQREDQSLRLDVSTANVDMLDPAISWGTHLNVSVSNELWEDLFVTHSHPSRLAFVSSAVAAGIAFFGAGYLLPLREGSVVYSLSARAHHLSRLHTLSTTDAFQRGILNTRREAHGDYDRLHLIGFDIGPLSAALLACYMQCVLAAAEEGYSGMLLHEPVKALRAWSWNVNAESGALPATALLIDGRRLTLPAYIRELVRQLLAMCEGGLLTEAVTPEARELLPLVSELTEYAERGELAPLSRHLDWAAKLLVLQSSGLRFDHPSLRLADHDFVNTNRQRGAFWRLWEHGLVDPLVTLDDASACLRAAPRSTRAWTRGELIRRFGPQIVDVDWSHVELRTGQDRWGPRLRIDLPRIDEFTADLFEPVLAQVQSLDDLLALRSSLRASPVVRRTDPLTNSTQLLDTDTDRFRPASPGLQDF